MRKRLSLWLPISGIPALFPDGLTDPDAMSGGGGGQPVAEQLPDPQPDLGDAGKKALAEERARARAAEKRAAEAEARLKAQDEEKLSEQERAANRAKEAEERAAKAEAKAIRLEVAAEAGLPISMAGRLTGSTKDELAADAEQLLTDARTLVGRTQAGTNSADVDGATPPPAQKTGQLPKPDKSMGGGRPTETGSVAAGADLYAQRKKPATPLIT